MNETSHYSQSQHNLDVKLEAIERVVETSFRAKLGDAALMMPPKFIYWDASFFNLESSTLFSRMPEADREALLFELSQNTLAEIFFLESFGMSFALKMGIVAQSLQEKLFFSLMAGEEALHLRSLMPFLARPPRLDERGFAQNIARMIDQGSRDALMVLIQVVAKGWQVTTFAKLAKNCQNEALAATLRAILQDESRHHGMGLVLASADSLNENDRAGLAIAIADILMGIRQGPITLVAALSRRIGTLCWEEKRLLLEQTRAMIDVQMQLELMKSLLRTTVDARMFEMFEQRGLFRPLSLHEMATL